MRLWSDASTSARRFQGGKGAQRELEGRDAHRRRMERTEAATSTVHMVVVRRRLATSEEEVRWEQDSAKIEEMRLRHGLSRLT